jgi:L-2-amino-thiazoline-4-carboxylic acid hydrolase
VIVEPSNLASSRRQFLLNILPAGTLFGLGCGNLSAWIAGQEEQKAAEKKHKFLEDSGMSFQEVFNYAYGGFAGLMNYLGNEIGKDKLIEIIKKNSDEGLEQVAQKLSKERKHIDFAAFRARHRKTPNRFGDHTVTSVVIEDTDKAWEVRITECLWAKTFRDLDAADIGYAYICHGDFAMARVNNPKIRLIRTKTLMQGHDCCNHRYVWEG